MLNSGLKKGIYAKKTGYTKKWIIRNGDKKGKYIFAHIS